MQELSPHGMAIARRLAADFADIREHKKVRPDEARVLYELIAATLRATEPMVLSQVVDPTLIHGELER